MALPSIQSSVGALLLCSGAGMDVKRLLAPLSICVDDLDGSVEREVRNRQRIFSDSRQTMTCFICGQRKIVPVRR